MQSKAYKQGVEHRQAGKSIWYNPYRHKGKGQQFVDWENGWRSVQE